MNKDSLISKDEYINGFKPGSIIYPNAFASLVIVLIYTIFSECDTFWYSPHFWGPK